MLRHKDSLNKITVEVKEQLLNLIHRSLDSTEIGVLDTNQKPKLLQ